MSFSDSPLFGLRKRRIEDLDNNLESVKQRITAVEEKIQESENDPMDPAERSRFEKEIADTEKQLAGTLRDIASVSGLDPEQVEVMKHESESARDAANRWTDNVFSIKQWCKRKFAIEERQIDKQFGIPEEFDYVE